MRGTSTSDERKSVNDPRASDALVARSGGQMALLVRLRDERVLVMPLWLYPVVFAATARQQKKVEVIAGGRGVRWPDLDVDVSVRGMLDGRPDVTRVAKATARAMSLKSYLRALAAFTPTRRAG